MTLKRLRIPIIIVLAGGLLLTMVTALTASRYPIDFSSVLLVPEPLKQLWRDQLQDAGATRHAEAVARFLNMRAALLPIVLASVGANLLVYCGIKAFASRDLRAILSEFPRLDQPRLSFLIVVLGPPLVAYNVFADANAIGASGGGNFAGNVRDGTWPFWFGLGASLLVILLAALPYAIDGIVAHRRQRSIM